MSILQILQIRSIVDNFKSVPIYDVSGSGKQFRVAIGKDVDFDKEAVYVNVQQEHGDMQSRGKVYHTLRFVKKEKLEENLYSYTFENVSTTGKDIVKHVVSPMEANRVR